MTEIQHTFATISPEAKQHSDRLLSLIVAAIKTAGGQISFADYMQHCLYQPGLGYYSAGLSKIGKHGDFITAPEISSLFSQALAIHVADALTQIPQGDCLEFGAGTGRMAVDLLSQLAATDALPVRYYIIEASADLRNRQQQLITAELGTVAERVIWLTQLPNDFRGVILANEVCDAMPVHQIQFVEEGIYERCISWQDHQLQWLLSPLSSATLSAIATQLKPKLPGLPFTCEINLQATAWLASLADRLQQGAIFIIDYGHADRDYFQLQRASGSVRCHLQHHVHDDPLLLPALQDITAHVNFTALAESAVAHGLQVSGYQRQVDFLLAGDITNLAQQQTHDHLAQLQQAAALKRLLLPEQMGELFKVLTLTKQLAPLPRLQPGDLRYCL